VNENAANGTVVGDLSSTDPDAGNSFTYTFIAPNNDAGGRFGIASGQLVVANGALLDYETNVSHQITIRTTDQDGLTFDKTFTIAVNNVNEAPTNIALSASSVNENAANGTVIGDLSTTDPDTGNTFTYTFVAPNNDAGGRFGIAAGQLVVANGTLLDYEAATSHQITIRTTDQGGLTFDKTFTIDVNYVDTLAPTAILSSTAAPGPTSLNPIPVTLAFSEPVTGLLVDEIQVMGGVAGNLQTTDSQTFTFDVTPSTNPAAVQVSLGAGAAQDAAGNPSTAPAPLSIGFSSNRPAVTVTSVQAGATRTSPIVLDIDFSTSVSGFSPLTEPGDLLTTHATVLSISGTARTYQVQLVPTGEGPVQAEVPAGAALDVGMNTNDRSNLFQTVYDITAPTVTLSSAAPDPTNISPIPVTVTFSEPVSGLTASGITANNATVENLSGSDDQYSFNLVPTIPQGTVSAQVTAGAAQDAAGNANTSSTLFSRTFDSIAPIVTSIVRATASPTRAASVDFTVTFSKGVSGVSAANFTVNAPTLSGASVDSVTGSGGVYTVTVPPFMTARTTPWPRPLTAARLIPSTRARRRSPSARPLRIRPTLRRFRSRPASASRSPA
jgi:hypothetical protein